MQVAGTSAPPVTAVLAGKLMASCTFRKIVLVPPRRWQRLGRTLYGVGPRGDRT